MIADKTVYKWNTLWNYDSQDKKRTISCKKK